MDTQEEVVRQLAQAIAHYLMRNPQAADGIAGIANWWVPQEVGGGSVESVQAAVDRLCAQGLMAAAPLPDGQRIYGLASQPRREPDKSPRRG
jgi:hypothetical protein